MQSLSQAQLQTALSLGAIRSVQIQPEGAQFAVHLLTRTGDAVLVQARKPEPRLFGSLDSAVRLLRKLGVTRIALEGLDQWRPDGADPQRRRRPDRAQALSRAAEYDRWVQAKVQASRDDPRPDIDDAQWRAIRASRTIRPA